jgi:hypothetical protein
MNRQEKANRVLQYITFAILLYGFKLRVIFKYGSATPYWDQWDGEAANLYKPVINNTFELSALFSAHNEHRIFTTRLLALALLKINIIWNPLLQMVVNAGLHITAIILSIHLLLKVIGQKYLPLLLLFSFFLFIVPYAWENTLGGFQSQFYFVLIFSIATVWYSLSDEPFTKRWWIGILCAVLAFFSLASGVFAIGAAAVVSIVFYVLGLRKSKKQLYAIVILIGLMVIGLYLTPSLPDHELLKATSFGQLFSAFLSSLSWPLAGGFFPALIRNAPALIFIGILLYKRPPVNDKRWFLLALIVWSVGQSMSIAYGRAVQSLSSRYLDLFAIGILINFACLVLLLKDLLDKRKVVAFAGIIIWTAIIFISLKSVNDGALADTLAAKRSQGVAQEKNVSNYLKSRNIKDLKNKGSYEIPYPDPERLGMILNWPEIRNILPATIRQGAPAGRLDGVTYWMLSNYYLFMIIGQSGVVLLAVYELINIKKK